MEIRVTIEVLHPSIVGTVIDSTEVLIDEDYASAGGLGDIEVALDEIIHDNTEED